MQSGGRVNDVGLPEIFRLLKVEGESGVLKLTAGRHHGEVFFRGGQVCDATSTDHAGTLGERLVRSGALRADRLDAVLADRDSRDPGTPPSLFLKEADLVASEALEAAVREQIGDCAFDVLGWAEAEFRFARSDAPPAPGVVMLDAESVIVEGQRRIDEWADAIAEIGSLERVPALILPGAVGKITIHTREWAVVCYVDGRRDVNTIVAESGLDRRTVVRIIHRLLRAGLVVVRDPTLELLGQRVAVAIVGPIDIYNLTFLTTICDSEISHHLRIETVDEQETEVHMSAGVRGEGSDGQLFYFCEARTPGSLLRRIALETSGYVLLVNVNSRDSVVASRPDIALMGEIKDRPWVVAAYASIGDETIQEEQVRDLLAIPEPVPIIGCSLRDPQDAAEVVDAVLGLIP
jgi:hypothetical protein